MDNRFVFWHSEQPFSYSHPEYVRVEKARRSHLGGNPVTSERGIRNTQESVCNNLEGSPLTLGAEILRKRCGFVLFSAWDHLPSPPPPAWNLIENIVCFLRSCVIILSWGKNGKPQQMQNGTKLLQFLDKMAFLPRDSRGKKHQAGQHRYDSWTEGHRSMVGFTRKRTKLRTFPAQKSGWKKNRRNKLKGILIII